nr:hypothetical protein [Tanacetum cinerariifolium]
MDDEPTWDTDRVVALTPGFVITIPETANEFSIKETQTILDQCHHRPTGGHYGPNVTAKKKRVPRSLIRALGIPKRHNRIFKKVITTRASLSNSKIELFLFNLNYCNNSVKKGSSQYERNFAIFFHFEDNEIDREGLRVSRDSFAYKEYGMRLMLEPRSTKALQEKVLKLHGIRKLSRKLDDALWAFRTAYKTPTGTTPYKLIYGKKTATYHLKLNHRAYWALKNCNPDLIAAGEKRMF